MIVRTPLAILAMSILTTAAHATDLGQVGRTWPIAEPDFTETIIQKLKGMEETGELQKHQERFTELARQGVQRPKPVRGITWVSENASRLFDPSVMVTEDLRDGQGGIIAPAGTIVNPLDYVGLTRPIFMIDGDDQRQVAMAKDMIQKHKDIVLMLVNGDYIETTKSLQYKVYFDQMGQYSQRFHIKAVPALITQSGKRLKIDEIAP